MSDFLKTLPQYVIPKHLLSRCIGFLADSTYPKWLKNAAIRAFIRHYKVNMQEALLPDPESYTSFNDFFTRHLVPGVRPIDQNVLNIVSPADGTISELGDIQNDKIIQAKNHSYLVKDLLGGDSEKAKSYLNGQFITIYLAPRDYHRVHMPISGNLKQMCYVPGKLFSVNQRTANQVPELFSRNERVITFFQTPVGEMAVVLVGAMIVASIATAWAGLVAPSRQRQIQQWNYNDIFLDKGQELGYFQLGSTVIVLFQANQIQWHQKHLKGQAVRFGEVLATSRS